MKKKLLVILSLIMVMAMIFALPSCGGRSDNQIVTDGNTDASDADVDTDADTEIPNSDNQPSESDNENNQENNQENENSNDDLNDDLNDDSTGDDNTSDDNTGNDNIGDDNTGDDNTGDDNTGDDNIGDDNTGDDNTGDDNTGDDNTGDDNTGDDNTDESIAILNAAPVRNGNKVIFGVYPQTKVNDSTLTAELDGSNSAWILSNGTWYADVTNGENKYRGVKLAENGTATWFKYEPISWTILEEKDGKALVLCDTVIEILAFDESNSNNYEESTIRAWLNENFINTAFGELAQDVIATIEVDNSNASTGYGNARFTCDNTFDKIFLLSRAELKNTLYGFTTDGTVEDANRKKQASEYAIARLNGGYVATSGAWWWMRTGAPHATDTTRADLAHTVKINGTINNVTVNSTTGGVVPAMWITL